VVVSTTSSGAKGEAKATKIAHYDLIIVGAGLAGAALAAGAAKLDLRIALIEANTIRTGWPQVEPGLHNYDARVSALTLASQQLLESLEVWEDITDRRTRAYTDMQVWDAEGTGSIHFNAADVDQPALGQIVENRIVNAALLNAVQASGRVHCLGDCPVQALQKQGSAAAGTETYRILLEDGRCLAADLIVAADGAMSRIRSWAEFETREWAYGHKAIACTVKSASPHQATAWQRFLPTGPLAFLPLGDDGSEEHKDKYCSIVWSALPERADELMAMDDADFQIALAESFEHTLGNIEGVSQRFCFPLRQRHAVDYFKPGLALIGDAAHSIHPLAGQGINLGFQDVAALLEELARACERDLSIGESEVLRRYQRARKGDNLAMMAAMDGFKYLFAQDALPVRLLRNRGMSLLNQAEPMKRQVIKQAMGL
jgi:2-octaprenylphenol hydroxylase